MSGNLVEYKQGSNEESKLTELVNQEVANFTVLYTKLHNYHWFVNGPHFFSLHAKLEELYNEVSENLDQLAERLLALGQKPVATLKEILEITTLKEATGNENTETMVKTVIQDFEMLSNEFSKIIDFAESHKDHVTTDMFVGMKESLNKNTWMLRAYLGN